MDYQQQEKFLHLYARVGVGLLALSAIGTAVLAALTTFKVTLWVGLADSVLVLALSVAIYYVPKYLTFTIEDQKKFSWTIRIRWILGALLLVGGAFGCRFAVQWASLMAAVTLLMVTNLAVRKHQKQVRSDPDSIQNSLWFVPYMYAAGDALVLAFLFLGKVISLEIGTLLSALAVHLLILLLDERHLKAAPIIFVSASAIMWMAGCRGPHLGVLALWMTASLALNWLTRDRHRRNLEATLNSLVNFTGENPEHVRSRLLTSTGTLAINWHAAPPKSSEELENWYRVNAGYYLYDLSQFHLAYKHITFSLDVLSQSLGRVLDYGAGIGDLALELAARETTDVTYFDVDGESQHYARWRARERGLRLQFIRNRENLDGPYDTIILLDVLEHLADPEETLEFLLARLAPGGRLIASIAFGPTKAHPMHFDHKLDVKAWLEKRGFHDAKSWRLKLFGSEAMRRKGVIIYRKPFAR